MAVSKFHPASMIMEAYSSGQRVFGENRPQELAAKAPILPKDIYWHFIGHLQTNKLKLVLPYVSMVESIDSERLLRAVADWAVTNGRVIDVLLELHVASEETKQGFTEEEILDLLRQDWPGINFRGLMGMATNTDDERVIRADFSRISAFKKRINEEFPSLTGFDQLSIGMSSDWELALEYGATIVRIGTYIFGDRVY